MTWYVVAYERDDIEPGDKIWTLSKDPKVTGWNTDCGFPGYGLLKEDAEELANAANEAEAKKSEVAADDMGTDDMREYSR